MTIHYKCRHCQTKVGQISEYSNAATLGFHTLTSEERQEFLKYENNGDIHVQVVCEDCEEALMRNPIFYELDTFIQ
ncbi:anti-sigma-F factor Fin family protein [Bacillus sp. FJAT-45037]|uniref:anti-sigma-F factor Fin family protein n=1 Tax=Bacillus sp. FJAT-45037 TaxID=2011007 RepID=UPI000C24A340|nr:anti-sigma-F factor Fin family protein [Bacillus sp. FJAT-45037]